jgi:(2S)-methylsuccinyl-CoA dehydrogenase
MDDVSLSATPLDAGDALNLCRAALTAAQTHLDTLRMAATALAAPGGPVDPARLTTHQYALHGYAWMATYVTALAQLLGWAERLQEQGKLAWKR